VDNVIISGEMPISKSKGFPINTDRSQIMKIVEYSAPVAIAQKVWDQSQQKYRFNVLARFSDSEESPDTVPTDSYIHAVRVGHNNNEAVGYEYGLHNGGDGKADFVSIFHRGGLRMERGISALLAGPVPYSVLQYNGRVQTYIARPSAGWLETNLIRLQGYTIYDQAGYPMQPISLSQEKILISPDLAAQSEFRPTITECGGATGVDWIYNCEIAPAILEDGSTAFIIVDVGDIYPSARCCNIVFDLDPDLYYWNYWSGYNWVASEDYASAPDGYHVYTPHSYGYDDHKLQPDASQYIVRWWSAVSGNATDGYVFSGDLLHERNDCVCDDPPPSGGVDDPDYYGVLKIQGPGSGISNKGDFWGDYDPYRVGPECYQQVIEVGSPSFSGNRGSAACYFSSPDWLAVRKNIMFSEWYIKGEFHRYYDPTSGTHSDDGGSPGYQYTAMTGGKIVTDPWPTWNNPEFGINEEADAHMMAFVCSGIGDAEPVPGWEDVWIYDYELATIDAHLYAVSGYAFDTTLIRKGGRIYFSLDRNYWYFWNGSAWVNPAPAGSYDYYRRFYCDRWKSNRGFSDFTSYHIWMR